MVVKKKPRPTKNPEPAIKKVDSCHLDWIYGDTFDLLLTFHRVATPGRMAVAARKAVKGFIANQLS